LFIEISCRKITVYILRTQLHETNYAIKYSSCHFVFCNLNYFLSGKYPLQIGGVFFCSFHRCFFKCADQFKPCLNMERIAGSRQQCNISYHRRRNWELRNIHLPAIRYTTRRHRIPLGTDQGKRCCGQSIDIQQTQQYGSATQRLCSRRPYNDIGKRGHALYIGYAIQNTVFECECYLDCQYNIDLTVVGEETVQCIFRFSSKTR
jgi:hypothetical protein